MIAKVGVRTPLEHLFIGELVQELGKKGRRDIEILRAEIDFAGYDLVVECNGVLLHVQAALHTRLNRMGTRSLRPNLRVISESKFKELATMGDLVTRLFGAM